MFNYFRKRLCVLNTPLSLPFHIKLFPNIWGRYNYVEPIILKMKNIEWIHKIHKQTKILKKCLLRKTDSIFQLELSNLLCWIVGGFRQYFVPMSAAFHANSTINSVVFSMRISSLINLQVVICYIIFILYVMLYVLFLILQLVWSALWSEAKYKCTLHHLGPLLS